MAVTALGMIETVGLVCAIEAADVGLKTADVRLLGTDYVRGGLVMVRFEGDVSAVKSAVDAGQAAARRIGHVLSAHVIARAMPEVFCMLASDISQGPAARNGGGCAACGGCEGGRRECLGPGQISARDLDRKLEIPNAKEREKWTVGNLRKLARKLQGFPLSPGEIRYANKSKLFAAFDAWQGKE